MLQGARISHLNRQPTNKKTEFTCNFFLTKVKGISIRTKAIAMHVYFSLENVRPFF